LNRVARKGSELFVQPAELARKLVKEMEDRKVSRPPHVSVRNRYTIFLCEEDWDRLRESKDQLAGKLERHLAKHVRTKKYQTAGDISVDLVCDPDLKLGHFGILAEKATRGLAEEDLPGRFDDGISSRVSPDLSPGVAGNSPAWDAGLDEEPRLGLVGPIVPPGAAAGVPRLPSAGGKGVDKGAGREAPAKPAPVAARGRSGRAERESGSTKVIPAAEVADLGLARETIVIKSGNRVREFSQGRVVVGRAADADFRIDNPDVSRRHAALYWSNGKIVIEDLGSTNGTMVNGYPVSSTVIAPSDVIVIGDCKLTAQAR
jgi:Protein of unknown function (DUF3662)/FHA domain